MKSTPVVKTASPAKRFALWRNRDYMLLWSGQLVSSVGTTITQTAYPLLVWDLSHSAALVGLVGGLGTLPYLLLSLIAGALVDRWNRKRVMIICDAGRALNLVSVLTALFLKHLTIVQICVCTLVEGVFYVFFNLAEVACLPRVVDKKLLPQAVAQNDATMSTTSLVGPLLGGALYSLSQVIPFLCDALSYAISVLTLNLIKAPFQEERQRSSRKILAEIGEGLSWLWHQPLIRYIAFLTGGLNLINSGTVPILLVLVKQQHGSSLLYGAILTIGGAGGILGSLLGAPVQQRFRFGQVIICVLWVNALLFPLYAVAPNPIFLGVILACLFITSPIYNVVQFSYRAALIPDALQGRVNSVFRLMAFGFQPIGWVLGGLFIQWFQVTPTILIFAAWGLFLAILTSVNRHVIAAGRPGEIDLQV